MKRLAVVCALLMTGLGNRTAFAELPPVLYEVKPGDTTSGIAERFHTDVAEIAGRNKLKDPDLIHPGQRLLIPRVDPKVAGFEKRVLELTNQARVTNGLKPLAYNWELTRMARHKSEDMRDRGYFAHQSPTYGSPFDMMRAYQITFHSAGENIAAGQATPEEVVKRWLNSPDHRRNILNPGFAEIGCGVAFGGNLQVYWTQEFISR